MRRTACMILVLSLAAVSPAFADERKRERPEPTRKEKAIRAAETVVITNDVLEALYGSTGSTEPAAVDAPEAEAEEGTALPDPLQAMRDQAGRKRTLRALAADTRKEVAAAEAEVRRLEKRALAVKNPYMPRPEIRADEKEHWDSLDNRQRLQKTEQELAAARERLRSAREKLAKLEQGS